MAELPRSQASELFSESVEPAWDFRSSDWRHHHRRLDFDQALFGQRVGPELSSVRVYRLGDRLGSRDRRALSGALVLRSRRRLARRRTTLLRVVEGIIEGVIARSEPII